MYLEDYEIGKKYYIEENEVKEEEMIEFATKYDRRPFHLDSKAAKNTRFGKIFASGFFTLCFSWSKWANKNIDTEGIVAGIGIDNLLWIKPVFAGDKLKSILTITAVVPSKNKNVGTIYAHYETTNQDNIKVFEMDVKYLAKKRPMKE